MRPCAISSSDAASKPHWWTNHPQVTSLLAFPLHSRSCLFSFESGLRPSSTACRSAQRNTASAGRSEFGSHHRYRNVDINSPHSQADAQTQRQRRHFPRPWVKFLIHERVHVNALIFPLWLNKDVLFLKWKCCYYYAGNIMYERSIVEKSRIKYT